MSVTSEMIEAAKTPAGGWTKAQLAEWGVPWPPPKGWKAKLIRDAAELQTRKINRAVSGYFKHESGDLL